MAMQISPKTSIERVENLTPWPNSRSCVRVLRAQVGLGACSSHDRAGLTVVVEKLFVEDSVKHTQAVRQGKGEGSAADLLNQINMRHDHTPAAIPLKP